MVKNPTANAGDAGSIPRSGRSSGGENGNPPQYSCLEKSHGQRSLVGYCPGYKKLDTTEQLACTSYNPVTKIYQKLKKLLRQSFFLTLRT